MTEGESKKYCNYANIRRTAIISEECFGGGEWESNPPRTGKRPFPGFEVRTPHRGRFSSIWNDRNRLMAWTAENEGAKISFWTQTGPRRSKGVLTACL